MKRGGKFLPVIIALALMAYLSPFGAKIAAADEQELFTSGSTVKPNVLLILDNSQSMDEDFDGNSIGPMKTGSRLTEGKRALQTMVNTYADQMRLGLMTYKLPAVTANHLHNAAYHVSYDPKSYCPSPPDACKTQCYCHGCDAAARTACQTACVAQNPSFDVDSFDEVITAPGSTYNTEKRKRYCDLVWPKKKAIPNPNAAILYFSIFLPLCNLVGLNQQQSLVYRTNRHGTVPYSDIYLHGGTISRISPFNCDIESGHPPPLSRFHGITG